VAQEAIHSLKRTKTKGMLVKLDLAKAYDRLNWDYLQGILKAFSFYARWISWIMSMVTTPVLSIMLNGSPTNAFNATRGLIQGDPLSPFLFILVVEGLGRYIEEKVQSEQYIGLRLWGNDLPLTHQQFIDDIIMYGQASLKEARKIMEILSDFTSTSGTEINKDKSDIFFFNTTTPSQVMGFRIGNFAMKYLGIQLND